MSDKPVRCGVDPAETVIGQRSTAVDSVVALTAFILGVAVEREKADQPVCWNVAGDLCE